jgi:hypothetical protein
MCQDLNVLISYYLSVINIVEKNANSMYDLRMKQQVSKHVVILNKINFNKITSCV